MHEGVAQRVQLLLVIAALLAAILICYWPVSDFEFTNWDDHRYITRNSFVLNGLTAEGISYAFTSFEMGNWHPLTWLSHMLDAQLFEVDGAQNPGGHHLVSVAIHCLNAIMMLLILQRMTGSLWRSALVAALFAVHPLRVESVAWVSERKDVLSTLFGFAALWFYIHYAQTRDNPANDLDGVDLPTAGRTSRKRRAISYLLMIFCFALSLMCKPMLVTLPFGLLLLDFCPLGRFGNTSIARLIIEKLPLLALSIISGFIALAAQQQSGAVSSINDLPVAGRLVNAIMAYAIYIRQMFWPVDLAPLYPLRSDWPLWQLVLSAALLLSVTTLALVYRCRWPHVLVGWLWYLGMLMPVIGLVQIGSQAHADRYTYVPLIGLFMALVWSIPDRWVQRRLIRPWLVASCLLILAALMAQTSLQVRHWRNSITLAQRAIDVTERNAVAHFNLGIAYSERGDFGKAATQFSAAAQITPHWADVHYNMANLLRRTGHLEQAIDSYMTALECDPHHIDSYINLGTTLAAMGKLNEAIEALQTAVQIDGQSAQAHLNLAVALAEAGRLDDAIVHYRRSLELQPDNALADLNLGYLFGRQGNIQLAALHFQKALKADPSSIQARMGYATALKDLGQTVQAIQHLRIAAERARATEQWTLHQQIQERIELYQQQRDSSTTSLPSTQPGH